MKGDFSSKKLEKARTAKNLSRYAVAKAAGMHYSNYWRLEKGKKIRPSVNTISRVANAVGVKLADLLD